MSAARKTSPIVTIAITSVIAALASIFNWFSSIDTAYYDFLLKKNLLPYPDDVVVVAIDEASIERLGAWPWDRRYHAQLLARLSQADAIVFDLIFGEPQSAILDKNTNVISPDQQFSAALKLSGNVVLPVFIEELSFRSEMREVMPIPLYANAAAALGHAHVDYSGNGVAKGLYLREGLGKPYWPHLSLALTDMLNETPDSLTGKQSALKRSPLIETHSPYEIYRDYYHLLRFIGPPNTLYRISYIDVLDGLVAAEQWQDKRVFVGATAKGLGDDVPTPLGAMPGVEFNANAYHAIRLNAYVSEPDAFLHAFFSVLIVAVLAYLFSHLAPAQFLLMTFVSILSFSGLTFASLLWLNYWFSPIAAVLAMLIFYPLWSWRRIEIALNFLQQELSILRKSSPTSSLNLAAVESDLKKLAEIGVIDNWSLEKWPMDFYHTWPGVRYSKAGAITGFYVKKTPYRLKIESRIEGSVENNKLMPIMSALLSGLNTVDESPTDSYELVEKTVKEIYSIKNIAEKAQMRMNKSMAELQDAVMVADAAGKIIFTNDNFCRLFSESFVGRSVVDLQNSVSAYVWLSILRTLMVDRERVYQEIQISDDRCLLCQAAIIADQKNPSDTLIFVFTDVTRLRYLERGKNEALAFLSHDMRSPIVSLLSLLESYRLNSGEFSENENEFIQQIEYFARKNLKYSEDFLQLSRAENINRDVFQLVDMHGVVDGAYAQVFGYASNKKVEVSIDRSSEDCWVSGDVHLLERAVTNILYNAVQHTPKNNRVSIKLYAKQGIHVDVSDTGSGIPSELIPHLFEPYFRARRKQKNLLQSAISESQRTTYGAKSYGLGLSFVHTVVKRHGGNIHVESELGKSTSFNLTFPAVNVE